MTRLILLILILLFQFLSPVSGHSQEDPAVTYELSIDTTRVEVRSFDAQRVKELKEDPDFQYTQSPTLAESLWQRFLQLLAQFFQKLFAGAMSTNWGRVFVYAAGVIAIVILVMMVFRINAYQVFLSGADRGSFTPTSFEENIHEMDFESLIHEAILREDYRQGVRLVFLHALKILSDRQVIHWQAGKTNHDYVEEIRSSPIKSDLKGLSFYFDYAWYGHFSVSEAAFRKTERLLGDLKQNIRDYHA